MSEPTARIIKCDNCGAESAPVEFGAYAGGTWQRIEVKAGYRTGLTFDLCSRCSVPEGIRDAGSATS